MPPFLLRKRGRPPKSELQKADDVVPVASSPVASAPNSAVKKTPTTKDHILESYDSRLENETAMREKLEADLQNIRINSMFTIQSQLEDLKTEISSKLNGLAGDLEKLHHLDRSESKKKALSRKQFVPQESLLSKMLLYNDENYKTINNILVVTAILWACALAFDDFQTSGRVNLDLLAWAFVKDFPEFCRNWICLFGMSLAIVPLAHVLAEIQSSVGFALGTCLYLAIQLYMGVFTTRAVQTSQFAMPLAAALLAEQVRIGMKMHSYMREKVCWMRYHERYVKKPISNGSFLGCAMPEWNYFTVEVQRFIEFIFIPTLVFRDHYPRTNKTRWDFVLFRMMEIIGTIYFFYLLFRTTLPALQASAGYPIDLFTFVKLSFHSM
jgi:hypothetical protein